MRKYLVILLVIFTFSCSNKDKQPLVVVSKNYNKAFTTWLAKADSNILVVEAYGIKDKDSLAKLLQHADGIIISGGEDINPKIYGKASESNYCGQINPYRDTLEMIMINYAYSHKIPLLGICRGHQMLNVTFGGSLITDIPTFVGSDTMHRNNGRTWHKVYIKPNTLLHSIVQVDSGEVLSNHHQAIDKLGRNLEVAAYAPDSIIEAVELYDTLFHPFIMGLQWHPEGMPDDNPLNYPIRDFFAQKVNKHFVLKQQKRK